MTIAQQASRRWPVVMRSVVVTMSLLAFAGVAAAQAPAAQTPAPQTPAAPPAGKSEPISPQVMDQRLQERATLIQKVNPEGADRVVIYDLRWPRNVDEYNALGKHALLLVSAVTRNKKELPIKKVYLRVGEKDIVLQRVFSKRSEVAPSSIVGRLFGTSREDVLYLVPIGSLIASQVVFADFALNRTEFRMNANPMGPPAFIKADANQDGSDPAPTAVKEIVERDYPGYPINERRGSRRTSGR